jgi:hypothetical protein
MKALDKLKHEQEKLITKEDREMADFFVEQFKNKLNHEDVKTDKQLV